MNGAQLAELEGRAYRTVWDDGLWDLLIGTYLLLLGIGITTSSGYVVLAAAMLPGWALPIWQGLRHKITEPRVGYVRLQQSRRARINLGLWLGAAVMALIIAFGLWVGKGFEHDLRGSLGVGLVFAAPLAAAGYLLEMRRLYVYSLLILLERVLDYAVGPQWDWPFWPSGVAITLSALLVLSRFMRRHPVRVNEVGSDA
ncbi:MAG: hypothetical protein ACRD2X_16735 [Vicinamibacteraceae bacterium]